MYIQVNASAMVQYDTPRQDSHSLSRKPQVGDVRTNSLRVRVVAEPEALVQLLDLRVRRNLHGRPLANIFSMHTCIYIYA